MFIKLEIGEDSAIGNGMVADIVTNAFWNNEHTPPLIKSYVMAARQIKAAESKSKSKTRISSLRKCEEDLFLSEFKKLHEQLFDD